MSTKFCGTRYFEKAPTNALKHSVNEDKNYRKILLTPLVSIYHPSIIATLCIEGYDCEEVGQWHTGGAGQGGGHVPLPPPGGRHHGRPQPLRRGGRARHRHQKQENLRSHAADLQTEENAGCVEIRQQWN